MKALCPECGFIEHEKEVSSSSCTEHIFDVLLIADFVLIGCSNELLI